MGEISMANCREKPIVFSVAILLIVIGQFIYIPLHDTKGFFKLFMALFAISLQPLVRCFFDGLQEIFFACCVKRGEPSRYKECLRLVLDSWKGILLGSLPSLFAMIMYCHFTKTKLVTFHNFMQFSGIVAIGTFFKNLIITKKKQPVNIDQPSSDINQPCNANQLSDTNSLLDPDQLPDTNPSLDINPPIATNQCSDSRMMTLFENMYIICWDFFVTFKTKLDKFVGCKTFSEESVSERSNQVKLNLNKIILLVSTSGIDRNLHRWDNMIEDSITEVEGFPIYKWKYYNKDHQYIILRTQKPWSIIQRMCYDGTIDSVHVEDFSDQMNLFYHTMNSYFLKGKYRNECIPVFVEEIHGQMCNGWLVERIMENIRKNQGSSIGHQSKRSDASHLPPDEANQPAGGDDRASGNALDFPSQGTDQAIARNGSASGIRNRFTSQVQSNGIANQRADTVPDEKDGKSNLLQTKSQQDASSPVDPTPSCNDALDESYSHISDECLNHTTPLIDEEKDSTIVIDEKIGTKEMLHEKSTMHGEKPPEHVCLKPPVHTEKALAGERPIKIKEAKLPSQTDESQPTTSGQSSSTHSIL